MEGNHFMKVQEASEKTGIGEGLIYAWLNKGVVKEKIGDDGVKRVSLDSLEEYRKENPRYNVESAGKVLSMVVTDEVLPGRERRAVGSMLERRKLVAALATKMLAKDANLTGTDLHKKAASKGIKVGNRLIYEVLRAHREKKEAKKEARRPPEDKYGTFEWFCARLKGGIKEHRITGIELLHDPDGEPKLLVRREQSVTL